MVVNYWPVAAQKEENGSPFPVRTISRSSVSLYLKDGRRFTFRGITLYTKPTDFLEVGFLIRRKAGNAVARNKTRRLFRGLILNSLPAFRTGRGYLFLFHRSYFSGKALVAAIDAMVSQDIHAAE
jgi:ribonuclease P protein component